MSKWEKTILLKSRKMRLEFSESMYSVTEEFVDQKGIFGQGSEAIDSNRRSNMLL